MKKRNLLLLIMYFTFLVACGQSFSEFEKLFKNAQIPLLTKELIYRSKFYEIPKAYKLIPIDLSLKYICKGDSTKLKYSYYIPPMEDGIEPQEGADYIDYFAINKFANNEYKLFLYASIQEEVLNIYLDLYSTSNTFIGTCKVNSSPTQDYVEYLSHSFSLIDEEKIVLFTYNDIEMLNRLDTNKQTLRTEIVIEEKKFSTEDSFVTINIDTCYSVNKYMAFYTDYLYLEFDDPLQEYVPTLPVKERK